MVIVTCSAVFIEAWAVLKIWAWSLTAMYGIQPPPFFAAVCASAALSLTTHQVNMSDTKQDDASSKILIHLFVRPLTILGVVWVMRALIGGAA